MEVGLETILVGGVYRFLMVFARIGGALLLMPGFSAAFVNAQVRLAFALAFTLVVTPLVAVPPQPENALALGGFIMLEAAIGLAIGIATRLLMSALEVAGQIIALQSGLASAFVFNPQLQSQGSIPSTLLTLLAVLLLFVTDLHHLMIGAIVESYQVFPMGLVPPPGDAAEVATMVIARSFRLGAQLAAPFVVMAVVFYTGLGLLSRLMPQLQLFFIVLPIQIILGLSILALALPVIMQLWMLHFSEGLRLFLIP